MCAELRYFWVFECSSSTVVLVVRYAVAAGAAKLTSKYCTAAEMLFELLLESKPSRYQKAPIRALYVSFPGKQTDKLTASNRVSGISAVRQKMRNREKKEQKDVFVYGLG